MPKIPKILLLAVSVALVLTVFLGVNSSGVSAAQAGQDGAYSQMKEYAEVLRPIQTDYVTDPNIPDVTNGALRGLLESLDAIRVASPAVAKSIPKSFVALVLASARTIGHLQPRRSIGLHFPSLLQ
jgi:hypothetical protein